MKKLLGFIVLLVCLLLPATTLATCLMTYEKGSPDWILGNCVGSFIVAKPLGKTVFWNIYMSNGGPPDLVESRVDFPVNGHGQCYRGVACWPDFFRPSPPAYPPLTGIAVFEQRVRSYETHTDSLLGAASCVTVQDTFWILIRNCPAFGGGMCLDSLTPLAKTSGKDPAPTLIDPYCCSADEEFDCLKGGGEWNNFSCTCLSPIVIDVAGDGFKFTGAEGGVLFDPARTGTPEQVSWTAADSDDAWLVLDRNGNGVIDDGKELFGSSTPQPYLAQGESKNGFRALAVFDEAANGGNSNGQIDSGDSVFASLKLWQDRNHNGLSEGGELQSLANSEIRVIELDYKESRQKDEHGNWFRYRAKVRDAQGAQVGRWAWDVFLQRPH